MQELLTQLQEYLRMESDLPFPEFQEYFRKLIEELRTNFEAMSSEERIQARYICKIVGTNAQIRAGKSRLHMKQFRKINEKCQFWLEAIDFRLEKEGLSEQEIEDKMEQVAAGLEPAKS